MSAALTSDISPFLLLPSKNPRNVVTSKIQVSRFSGLLGFHVARFQGFRVSGSSQFHGWLGIGLIFRDGSGKTWPRTAYVPLREAAGTGFSFESHTSMTHGTQLKYTFTAQRKTL